MLQLHPQSTHKETGGRARRRWPPWVVLSLGFGGLLVCVVGAATGTLVELNHVRNDETQSG